MKATSKPKRSQALIAHTCNSSYSGDKRSGEFWLEANPGQIVPEKLSSKNPTQKKRLVEWLKP
jgi:hypothetical protein